MKYNTGQSYLSVSKEGIKYNKIVKKEFKPKSREGTETDGDGKTGADDEVENDEKELNPHSKFEKVINNDSTD